MNPLKTSVLDNGNISLVCDKAERSVTYSDPTAIIPFCVDCPYVESCIDELNKELRQEKKLR